MSKKAYARPQYKVKPAIIIIVAVIVFIFSALIVIIQPTDQEKIYNAYHTAGSPNITRENVFESISVSKLIKVIDSDEPVVVFFGTPTCQACVNEIGWYNIEFESEGLNDSLGVIYYVNTAGLSQDNIAKLQNKYGMNLTTTPEVYYLNGGEIVSKRADFNNQSQTMQLQIKNFFQGISDDLAN